MSDASGPLEFENSFMSRLAAALARRRVRYLVVGGVAVNFHHIERATHDVDLVLDFSPANVRRGIQALTSLRLRPRVPVPAVDFADPQKRRSWIREKSMIVFPLAHLQRPWEHVDVFVREPFRFQAAWRRRLRVRLGRVVVPVVSLADLIRMKRKAGRPQDLDDIRHLEMLRRASRPRMPSACRPSGRGSGEEGTALTHHQTVCWLDDWSRFRATLPASIRAAQDAFRAGHTSNGRAHIRH